VNSAIVRLNMVATAVFVVATVIATWVFAPWMRVGIVIVDLVLFAIGVVGFLWGPRPVRQVMSWCLGAQVVVGLTGAIVRNSTDGKPGSTLAFGVLVGMCGLGLNGMWAAKHGYFAPRRRPEESPDGPAIGKDGNHG
jgi:hypothetical protein